MRHGSIVVAAATADTVDHRGAPEAGLPHADRPRSTSLRGRLFFPSRSVRDRDRTLDQPPPFALISRCLYSSLAKIATSTLRFCVRPASVSFEATGSSSPLPSVWIRVDFTP